MIAVILEFYTVNNTGKAKAGNCGWMILLNIEWKPLGSNIY
jgi:hypothetical protein